MRPGINIEEWELRTGEEWEAELDGRGMGGCWVKRIEEIVAEVLQSC